MVSSCETRRSISSLLLLKSSDQGSAGSGSTGNKGMLKEAVEEEKVRARNETGVIAKPRRWC